RVADRLRVVDDPAALAIEHAATADPILTGNCRNRDDGAYHLAAVLVSLQTIGDLHDRWRCGRPEAGEPLDVFRRHARDATDALSVVLPGAIAEIPPAGAVLLEPLLVMKPLGEQHIDDAQGQGGIRSWLGLDMPVDRSRGQRAPWVDQHHGRPVALGVSKERHEVRAGAGRVVSPDHDQLAVEKVL